MDVGPNATQSRYLAITLDLLVTNQFSTETLRKKNKNHKENIKRKSCPETLHGLAEKVGCVGKKCTNSPENVTLLLFENEENMQKIISLSIPITNQKC